MITHVVGTDTRYAIDWDDVDGDPVDATNTTATLTDADGEQVDNVVGVDDTDTELAVTITIAHNATIGQGIYNLVITADGDGSREPLYVNLLRVIEP